MNFSRARQHRRARMYVRVVKFGERKRAGGGLLPILDQRRHSAVGFAQVVSHCKQALWKVLDLHKHPKVRRPNSTIAVRRITIMIVIDIFKENHRFSERTPRLASLMLSARPTGPQSAAGAERLSQSVI